MTSRRRTEFAAFVLDLLDFIEEKIQESLDDEASRAAAVGEAAGAVPVLRDRLRENDVVSAQFVLALANIIEPRWAAEGTALPRWTVRNSRSPPGISSGPKVGWPSCVGWSQRMARRRPGSTMI